MSIDNPKNLIEFVKANFPHDDYISEEDGKWRNERKSRPYPLLRPRVRDGERLSNGGHYLQ